MLLEELQERRGRGWRAQQQQQQCLFPPHTQVLVDACSALVFDDASKSSVFEILGNGPCQEAAA